MRLFLSILLTVTAAALPLAPASAEPVVLKCWDSSGVQTVDWTLDIEKRELKFGPIAYPITALTDTYVTAFNSRLDVGGEVIVLNRATGEFQRASVTMTCANDKCTETVLAQATFTGRCQRQQF